MADIVSTPTTSADAATSSKKSAKKGAKAARPKASHPPTAIMVTNAIKHMKERGGSSLQAIKKYIASTYKIDAEKLAPFIKKYIKASVINGELIQTKGKGASGSFKLATIAITKAPSTKAAKAKKPAAKKVKAKPKVEKPVASKKTPVKVPRKAPVERKTPVVKTKAAKGKKPEVVKTPVKKASPKAKITKAKSPAKATKKTASKKK